MKGGFVKEDETYGSKLFRAGADDELSRLKALASAFDPGTIATLSGLGSARGLDGWRCLDVGAGLGTVSRWLADRVGPRGDVIALDVNPRLLRDNPHPGVQIVEADITTDVELGEFDLVHARFVLAHLRSRDEVLPRLARMVRPGGYLVISDSVDLGTPASPHAAYRETVTGLWKYLGAIIGTDADYGLRHRAAFDDAGLHSIKADIAWPGVSHDSPLTEFLSLTLRQTLPRMIADGFITVEVAQDALAYLASPHLCDQSVAMITTQGRTPGP